MGSTDNNVILVAGDDKEILAANEKVRATFKYFWREMAWERRRIVPGLDLGALKFPFSDGDQGANSNSDEPSVEHMWIDNVDFDGRNISGTLLNSPQWLKTIVQGDEVIKPLESLDDWMYVVGGTVYGGYTVNLTRSRMSPHERKQHDAAWGLDFGDPGRIRLIYFAEQTENTGKSKGLIGSLMRNMSKASSGETESNPDIEHPASLNVVPSMKEALTKDPSLMNAKDERGWTPLHHEALAGSAATVRVLLDLGADASVISDNGLTPLDLARVLNWANVEALLLANNKR